MNKPGIPELLSTRKHPNRQRGLAMIAARILDPCSKLAMDQKLGSDTPSSSLGDVLAVDGADADDLYEALDWLQGRFGLKRVTMVGDRGMITNARIGEELRPRGVSWVTALRAPTIRGLMKEAGPLQLSLRDEQDLAEITSPDFPGERLVACKNPLLAADRPRPRQELVAVTE